MWKLAALAVSNVVCTVLYVCLYNPLEKEEGGGICELLETLHDIIVDERFCVREFTVSDIDAVWTLREMPNRQTMRNPDNRK